MYEEHCFVLPILCHTGKTIPGVSRVGAERFIVGQISSFLFLVRSCKMPTGEFIACKNCFYNP